MNPFAPQQQNPQIQFNQQSPIFNSFGGFQNFQNQFNSFMNSMSSAMNPNSMASYAENVIRQKLQSGQITQEQFNQFAQTANQMLGR